MTSESSKKKLIIATIIGLVVIAVVLIVIIVKINNDETETIPSKIASTGETEIDEKPEQAETVTLTPTSVPEPEDEITVEDKKTEDKNTEDTDPVIPLTVSLGKYKGIEAEYTPLQITDEIIDEKLEELQKENSKYIELPDRAFEDTDMAIVTADAYIDGQYYKEYSVYCIQDVIGSGLLPDFIEQDIIGRHKGDCYDVFNDYPSDYAYVPEIAGKTVRYNIELVDGFALYIPDLTDDFIKQTTKYSSIAACYTDMKNDLQDEENQKAEEEMTESIKKKFVDSCSFEGPIEDEIKKSYVLKLQQENEMFMENYFMEASTYYSLVYDMSISDYQKMVMDQAETETKYGLALDEVVSQEKLDTAYPELGKFELRQKAEELILDSALINGK